jgi:hypothetical protein
MKLARSSVGVNVMGLFPQRNSSDFLLPEAGEAACWQSD